MDKKENSIKKRLLKKELQTKAATIIKSSGYKLTLPALVAVISTILFCVTQLAINASLNPEGAKLEQLNTEKNLLIEENRKLQQEIAKSKSLTVITELAEKKLEMKDDTKVDLVFLSNDEIVASATENQ